MPQCRIRSLAPPPPPRPTSRSLFTRNSAPSLGVGEARKYAGSCCSHSTCSLAPSFLACSPSFSVYLFPARTLTRHSAAASTHFGLTCHFFTLSLSSSLSCSCSSSSSFARTPSCYVLWEFGMPSSSLAAIVSEIEWMDGWDYRWAVEFPGLPFSLIVPSTAIVKISVECTWKQILLLVILKIFGSFKPY